MPVLEKTKTMKKELKSEDGQELEILKAVAQAWLGHSSSCSPATEYDAHRQNFKSKPTRFRLEAVKNSAAKDSSTSVNWDFSQSLWDSYEIVTVSKRLEAGLVLDHPFSGVDHSGRASKRRKESKNSLRNLFSMSSRRFKKAEVAREGDNQF